MLLDKGAFVSILDLNEPSLEKNKPENVKFFKTDITETNEIEQAIAGTMKWISRTSATLAGVINCAGIASAAKVKSHETTLHYKAQSPAQINNPTHSLDLWNFVIAVNLTGGGGFVVQGIAELGVTFRDFQSYPTRK
jgi:3-hydroxyacyl-CoA dehydrogenase / 3-hydroxy-2-methylbutyryl-CoA dehydrogenase